MPTYEYRCEKCGQQFEVVQPFTAKPLRRHPDCGGAVEKVFHPRGVVFKGSGFYVTDSRARAGSKAAGTDAGDSKPNGSDKPDKAARPEAAPKPDPAKSTSASD